LPSSSLFQENIKEQHELLIAILDIVREGRTTYKEIRKGLSDKYGGALTNKGDGTVRVPSATIIAKILKYCRNDSPDLKNQIDEAFTLGKQRGLNANRPIQQYLALIKQAKTAES
jgi:hypothetical protein